MNSDIEELAREGMRQFTADLRASPDLVGRTFDGHRRRQRQRHVMRAGLALGAAGTVTAVTAITVAHGPVPEKLWKIVRASAGPAAPVHGVPVCRV